MTKIKNIMLAMTLGAAMIAGGGTAIAKSGKKDKKSKARTEQYCNSYCNDTCGDNCNRNCNDNCNNICTQNCTTQVPCAADSCRFPGRHHSGKEYGRHHGNPGKASGFRAMEGLDLTQAQKDSVKSIMKRQKEAVRAGERQLRQQARANTDKELQQLLTPEQFAKYQANREQLRKDAPKGAGRDGKQFKEGKRHHGDRNRHHADRHHGDFSRKGNKN